MNRSALLTGLVGLLLITASCGSENEPATVLTHDAYIWQRVWTPALERAVRDASDVVRAYRVLGLQWDAQGTKTAVEVDLESLRAADRPVVAVLRLDGQLSQLPATVLIQEARHLLGAWRRKGVEVVGVEVDYDCPSRQLEAYARHLDRWRRELGGSPETTSLAITLLPTWLGSDALPRVLAAVDEAILQTHSVLSPEKGLFDPQLARHWLEELAALDPPPFRVALPTYGHRVGLDDQGRVVAVESELRRGLARMPAQELFARPLELGRWVAELRRSPPRGLLGIAWFRLPTAEDRRAWSLETWRAVVTGQLISADPTVEAVVTATAGAFDLVAHNPGAIDGELPAAFEIRANSGCTAADALAHYRLDDGPPGHRFVLTEPSLLAAGERRLVGWIRCPQEDIPIHVEVN